MAISSPLKPKVSIGSVKTVKKFQTILFNRTRVRKEIFQRKTILQNRRIENERRKQLEDELEAPNLVTRPRGPSQLIAGSAKGFFDRLIGFLGYLTAGWIINNLPTWIAMGKEFIARTQQMGKILGGFITNSTDIFKDFTKLLGATLTNLMKFDFLDTSGRVKTAFDELNLSVENWGTGFEDAIKLLTTPLTEGIASGEDAPPTGTENTNEGAYERTAPYSGSGGSAGGKLLPIHKQALDIISRPESGGDYNAMNRGGAGDSLGGSKKWIGKNLTDMTIGEVISLQNQGKVYAAGRYQFVPIQLPVSMKYVNLTPKDRFDKNNQDLMAAGLMQDRGIQPWTVGGSKYSKQELAIVEKARKTPFGSSSSTSSPQQSTPGTGQSFRPLPQGSFKGGERQRYLAPREGTRKHLGIDITESNWKPGTDPRIPVVAIRGGVVSSRYYVGGTEYLSGMVIDQDDGYSVRYLHMTPSVGRGQKVSAGQRIGRLVPLNGRSVGMPGNDTHLHIELYSGSKLLDPTSYITTIEKGGVPAAISRQQSPTPATTQSPTPTPAQITPTGTPQNPQIPQSLAPERKGQTVIVSQNPSSPARQMMYSGGGGSSGGGSSPISDFALLNNFIKNKLLLDLAYL